MHGQPARGGKRPLDSREPPLLDSGAEGFASERAERAGVKAVVEGAGMER